MARPTHILKLISAMKGLADVEKIVEIRGQVDGMAALVRTKDGNAYEVTVVPAEYSKHPSIKALTVKKESFVDSILRKLEEGQ